MRHIDLTHKEVAGIIDHADNGVTAEKLAHDLDGVPIGLNADKLDGYHAAELIGPPESWLDALFMPINDFTNWLELTFAGAYTVRDFMHLEAHTSGTQNAWAWAYRILRARHSYGQWLAGIDWDKELQISWMAAFMSVGTAFPKYAWLRLATTMINGPLDTEGVGFQYNRNGIKMLSHSHDAVGLEEWDLGNVTTAYSPHVFRIHHKPTYWDRFFIDGTLRAQHEVRVPSGMDTTSVKISIGAYNPQPSYYQNVEVNGLQFYQRLGG